MPPHGLRPSCASAARLNPQDAAACAGLPPVPRILPSAVQRSPPQPILPSAVQRSPPQPILPSAVQRSPPQPTDSLANPPLGCAAQLNQPSANRRPGRTWNSRPFTMTRSPTVSCPSVTPCGERRRRQVAAGSGTCWGWTRRAAGGRGGQRRRGGLSCCSPDLGRPACPASAPTALKR
jgi:hypothetical protein